MKITNQGVSPNPGAITQPTPLAATGPDTTPADATTQASDTYMPSGDWIRLRELVKQQPEIREDRVRDVTDRLRKGEYSSAESAAKTADAILNGLD